LTDLTPQAKDYLDQLGNKAPGANSAVLRAQASTSWPVDMCLQWVRTQWLIPAKYLTAIDAWNAVPVTQRHGFYTPPGGVAVFWSGGSSGAGHVALSLGCGMIRTVSVIGTTNVSTDTIGYITKADPRLTYLGWTETLNGQPIYIKG
jgi:hypothetical protein